MSSTIKVAIAGVGYWGPNLVRNFSQIELCKLAWVCDLSQPRREYISREWPHVKTTGDFKDVLKDASIDAVIIATPLETHLELASAVLRAGKHVFIEKPMTARPEDDEVLLDLAEKKGLKIGTGHIFLYHPAIVNLRVQSFRPFSRNIFYYVPQTM